MNILLLANELRYTCGVTNHLLHLSKALCSSGEVKLWIICGGGNGINRFSDIDVTIISDERFLHSNRSFTTYVKAINYLVSFTRDNNIDIIHSHYHYGAAIASKAAALTGRITIQTNHGILPAMGRLKHFNADHYIAINEHIRQHILKNNIADAARIHFIRCGIPIAEPMPQKSLKGKIRVLAAARFAEGKGLDVYIHAVNKLPLNTFEHAEFFLAGEGALEDKLLDLNRSLEGKVKFIGKILDMYEALSHMHVLVNSSNSSNEGFPAIITEAGATNTLVVTSDFRGSSDVIKHGLNGLLYSNDSSENLANTLNDVIYNYKYYQPLGKMFYEFIKKEFSIELMLKKHLALYKNCLEL